MLKKKLYEISRKNRMSWNWNYLFTVALCKESVIGAVDLVTVCRFASRCRSGRLFRLKERLFGNFTRIINRDSSIFVAYFLYSMEHFIRRRWTTTLAPLVSFSVHEGKHFLFHLSGLFLKLIFNRASMVVHLLLL